MPKASYSVPAESKSVNQEKSAKAIAHIYQRMDRIPDTQEFLERCGITSLPVLTIRNQEDASKTVTKFWTAIAGKRVVEIGAGVGYLALEMAKIARSVVAIENEPAWSWLFTKFLYSNKPANLTWVFGCAGGVELSSDAAVICSRSGLAEMIAEARRLAPVIVLICCEEVVVVDRSDPLLDHMADYTKQRIEELFAEAEDALNHPEKRAAYERVTGEHLDWANIERKMKE